MIRRALSHLLDLTTLARTVHHLARERDALATLAGQLEGELTAMTDAAEALRHELADRTAPDGDHVAGCAADLRECAAGWDPDVRLLGNLTAREIAEVARRAMKAGPPRDAASPEAEVLRLAYRADRSWRDDVEAPALRQQLQAAEVELAAARAEVAPVREVVLQQRHRATESATLSD